MSLATALASRTVHEIFERVASDLSMLADRSIAVREIGYEERFDRPSAAGAVHISFRFGIDVGNDVLHGTLLAPLREAVAIAGYLMMATDEQVARMQEQLTLGRALKEALIEVGTFVAGASEAALRAVGAPYSRVVFEGCQGVRADVRPALVYEEGVKLAVGRALVSVADAAPSEFVVMFPRAAEFAMAS